MKFRHMIYPVLIHPVQVKELRDVVETEHGIKFGASLTLNEMHEFIKKRIDIDPGLRVKKYTIKFFE